MQHQKALLCLLHRGREVCHIMEQKKTDNVTYTENSLEAEDDLLSVVQNTNGVMGA